MRARPPETHFGGKPKELPGTPRMNRASGDRDPAAGLTRARHWGGFLISGAMAFAVDATMLEIGVRLLGLPPLAARLVAISTAMVVAWLAHRNLTFALDRPPTVAEFLRYAAGAWTTAALNYAVFAALLFAWPWTPPLAAVVIASIVATIFSYVAMRYGVFRRTSE